MSLNDKNLHDLTKIVFSRKYKYIAESTEMVGESGKKWSFDGLIEDENLQKFGVFIRDWKREISITQLRQLHKACMDIPEIEGGIMVANIITDFSKDYSKQFGIQLLSRGHLISKLRTQNFHY